MLLAAAVAPLLLLPATIEESSGAATSSVSDDWFFTHEDSGAGPAFSAVSTDGRLLATYDLGVDARDWEDMARGPGGLYLGDIGDNSGARELGLLVHVVAEPDVDPAQTGVERTLTPTSYRLRYEDGPRDAEALLVHPRTGQVWLVSKPLGGPPGVYAAPPQLDASGPNALTRVGQVQVGGTGTPGGPGIGSIAQALVTGGDVAPDGSRVALRTYTDLYEWPLDGDDVAAALQGEPVVTPLPPTFQGEAVAYTRDSAHLLVTTEGSQAPVHLVPSALAPGDEPGAAAVPPEDDGSLRRAVVVGAAAVVLTGALVASTRRWRRRRSTGR